MVPTYLASRPTTAVRRGSGVERGREEGTRETKGDKTTYVKGPVDQKASSRLIIAQPPDRGKRTFIRQSWLATNYQARGYFYTLLLVEVP